MNTRRHNSTDNASAAPTRGTDTWQPDTAKPTLNQAKETVVALPCSTESIQRDDSGWEAAHQTMHSLEQQHEHNHPGGIVCSHHTTTAHTTRDATYSATREIAEGHQRAAGCQQAVCGHQATTATWGARSSTQRHQKPCVNPRAPHRAQLRPGAAAAQQKGL